MRKPCRCALKRWFSEIGRGTILGGPHNKDYGILGSVSILGPFVLGNYQAWKTPQQMGV